MLRLYVNFFQPSLKLLSKIRDGSKVTKKYDKAKTPYQRLVCSNHISQERKNKLQKQYQELDPVKLLKDLEKLQSNFWKLAWKAAPSLIITTSKDTSSKDIDSNENEAEDKDTNNANDVIKAITDYEQEAAANKSQHSIRCYRRTKKPRKQRAPNSRRTAPDPFENTWSKICAKLESNPELSAKGLLTNLVKESPEEFSMSYLRTMQRRIAEWRTQQIQAYQEQHAEKEDEENKESKEGKKEISPEKNTIKKYFSLIADSMKNW